MHSSCEALLIGVKKRRTWRRHFRRTSTCNNRTSSIRMEEFGEYVSEYRGESSFSSLARLDRGALANAWTLLDQVSSKLYRFAETSTSKFIFLSKNFSFGRSCKRSVIVL